MLYTRVSACNVWWQSATAHGGRQKSSDFVCVFLSHLNLGLRCAQCVSHIVVVAVHLLVDFMFFFSDFKFGMQLGFAKGHHKITPRAKNGRGPGLGKLPKISGFSFNISAMGEAGDFKFCMQLGFAKAHHKITPRGKVGVGLG